MQYGHIAALCHRAEEGRRSCWWCAPRYEHRHGRSVPLNADLGPERNEEPGRSRLQTLAVYRLSVRFQGGPTGPLAPPTRRPRRRSRWRSRYGGASARRLARILISVGPSLAYRSYGVQPRGCPCSRCGIIQGRSEPVKAVCCRRATASVECVVHVHGKTALTEPALPRRWQRSGAWTRVARTVGA